MEKAEAEAFCMVGRKKGYRKGMFLKERATYRHSTVGLKYREKRAES